MPPSLFEEARRYFADHWRWYLHENTFEVLDKDTWVCKATTTFNAAGGQSELTFYVLHNASEDGQCPFDEAALPTTFDEAALPVLLDWCLKMAARK